MLSQSPFHHAAFNYYYSAYWNGFPDHLRDTLWEDISKFGASTAASEFCD